MQNRVRSAVIGRLGFVAQLALASAAIPLLACGARSARAAPLPDILIQGSNIYPESVTSAADDTVYVGSIKGIVYRAAPGDGSAVPWIRRTDRNDLLSVFGVLADDRSHTLWLCSSPLSLPGGIGTGKAAVMRFDLATGVQDGTLYVDNVRSNQLLRIERTPDGRFAGLVRLTTSEPIGAPDGLRLITGNRFLLADGRNGRLDEVSITGDRAAIRILRTGLMSPTSGTCVGNTAYALEGKIGYLIDPRLRGENPDPFIIRAISIPRPSYPDG